MTPGNKRLIRRDRRHLGEEKRAKSCPIPKSAVLLILMLTKLLIYKVNSNGPSECDVLLFFHRARSSRRPRTPVHG